MNEAQNNARAARRPAPGRPFPKGVSGNPGGRPKALVEVTELAKAGTTEAIDRLRKIIREGDDTAAVAAAKVLLDRGWGRPVQPVQMSGTLTTPQVVVRNPEMAGRLKLPEMETGN